MHHRQVRGVKAWPLVLCVAMAITLSGGAWHHGHHHHYWTTAESELAAEP